MGVNVLQTLRVLPFPSFPSSPPSSLPSPSIFPPLSLHLLPLLHFVPSLLYALFNSATESGERYKLAPRGVARNLFWGVNFFFLGGEV